MVPKKRSDGTPVRKRTISQRHRRDSKPEAMKKFDNTILGFLLGLLVPMIGAFFFYTFLVGNSFEEFKEAMQTIVLASPLLRMGAIFNLLLFFTFIWSGRDRSAKGVVISTFIYGGLAVYFSL